MRKKGQIEFEPMIRFWHMVKIAKNGCWLWQGSRMRCGYGVFYPGPQHGKHSVKAHRFSYEMFVGPIPLEMEIDHLCRERPCVNPNHLEAVSHKINVRRGRTGYKTKTHCVHGHPFSLENTYVSPQGQRQCKQCSSERQRLYQWKSDNIIGVII